MLMHLQNINVQRENNSVEIFTCDDNIFTHVSNNRTDKVFPVALYFTVCSAIIATIIVNTLRARPSGRHLQTTLSNSLFWMGIVSLPFKFHYDYFPGSN